VGAGDERHTINEARGREAARAKHKRQNGKRQGARAAEDERRCQDHAIDPARETDGKGDGHWPPVQLSSLSSTMRSCPSITERIRYW